MRLYNHCLRVGVERVVFPLSSKGTAAARFSAAPLQSTMCNAAAKIPSHHTQYDARVASSPSPKRIRGECPIHYRQISMEQHFSNRR